MINNKKNQLRVKHIHRNPGKCLLQDMHEEILCKWHLILKNKLQVPFVLQALGQVCHDVSIQFLCISARRMWNLRKELNCLKCLLRKHGAIYECLPDNNQSKMQVTLAVMPQMSGIKLKN